LPDWPEESPAAPVGAPAAGEGEPAAGPGAAAPPCPDGGEPLCEADPDGPEEVGELEDVEAGEETGAPVVVAAGVVAGVVVAGVVVAGAAVDGTTVAAEPDAVEVAEAGELRALARPLCVSEGRLARKVVGSGLWTAPSAVRRLPRWAVTNASWPGPGMTIPMAAASDSIR